MIIINDERVISHVGVKGMKWGVRRDAFLERERALRSKAEKVVKVQNSREKANVFDVNSAAYMSQSVSKKLFTTILSQTIGTVAMQALNGRLKGNLSDKTQLKRTITKIAVGSAMKIGLNELKGRGSLKRYTETGKQDLSKKQYKWMTPQHALAAAIKTAVTVAPFLAAYGEKKVREVGKRGKEDRERVEKWGDHLLGTKTSDMHTIFSDPEGYMSVLAKIPKD